MRSANASKIFDLTRKVRPTPYGNQLIICCVRQSIIQVVFIQVPVSTSTCKDHDAVQQPLEPGPPSCFLSVRVSSWASSKLPNSNTHWHFILQFITHGLNIHVMGTAHPHPSLRCWQYNCLLDLIIYIISKPIGSNKGLRGEFLLL